MSEREIEWCGQARSRGFPVEGVICRTKDLVGGGQAIGYVVKCDGEYELYEL